MQKKPKTCLGGKGGEDELEDWPEETQRILEDGSESLLLLNLYTTTKGTGEGTHTWALTTWHKSKEISMLLGFWHFSATHMESGLSKSTKKKDVRLPETQNASVFISWYWHTATIGQEGTPSGRNVGPAYPDNPAESGMALTSERILDRKDILFHCCFLTTGFCFSNSDKRNVIR